MRVGLHTLEPRSLAADSETGAYLRNAGDSSTHLPSQGSSHVHHSISNHSDSNSQLQFTGSNSQLQLAGNDPAAVAAAGGAAVAGGATQPRILPQGQGRTKWPAPSNT